MKEMKRVLALLLCAVMLVGVMPVSAFATEGETTPVETTVVTTAPVEPLTVEETASETTEAPIETTISETTEEVTEATTEATEEVTEATAAATEEETEATTEATEEAIPETTEETVPETTEPKKPMFSFSSVTVTKEAVSGEPVEDEVVEEQAVEVTLDVPSEDDLKADMNELQDYVNHLMETNDPETVVKNFGTHFSWDNEKREGSKDYLYDWSYYNGVVFEGLLYLYNVTGNSNYLNYVEEYMSSMIDENGEWAVCANDSAKTCAGYQSTHGADCYKTASMLWDLYQLTGDDRYQKMAQTLYADLDTAADSYLLENAGNNYRHTWASDPTPDLWLDGLYMIMPFQAEYAYNSTDSVELAAIVDRLTWVSENMYDEDKGLFYHAADSASSNSGTFWLRSIGWYAAAIADVMENVDASDREILAAQLTKLADGMKAHYNEGGMWLNDMASAEASNNPYETSGTALVSYALLKAVNNGWIDESYADMALTAFHTIATEKLSGNVLTDVCYIGAPGSSNTTFKDNEGKGVGPVIMLYAEVMDYTGYTPTQPAEPEEPSEPEETEPVLSAIVVNGTDAYALGDTLSIQVFALYDDGSSVEVPADAYTISGEYDMNVVKDAPDYYHITVTHQGVSGTFMFTVSEPSVFENNGVSVSGVASIADITVADNTQNNAAAAQTLGLTNYVSYDITPVGITMEDGTIVDLKDGNWATVSIPVPADWEEAVCYYLPESGEPQQAEGTLEAGLFTFRTNHFSTWLVGNSRAADDAATVASGTGNLVGGKVYTLDTDGVTANKNYLIVNTASNETGYALTNNNGTADRTQVTISDDTITVEDDTNIAWQFSGSTSGSVGNNGRYVNPDNNSLSLNESGTNLTISNQNNGAYRIYRYSSNDYYYLRYNNSAWTGSSTRWENSIGSVYLYELTSSSVGGTVEFTVTPGSLNITDGEVVELKAVVTVDGVEVDLSKCTITWGSNSTNVATVTGGTVTGVGEDSANITATLSAVDGTALQENIVLTIPVTVTEREIEFSVEPNPVSAIVGASETLTPTVIVDGVAATSYVIEWSSDKEAYATVDNDGVVTGVAEGSAYIAAKLISANDRALANPQPVYIPVTVTVKKVKDISLSSYVGYIPHNSDLADRVKGADGNPIMVIITYDDDTTSETYLTLEMVSEGYDININDEYTGLTVTYQDQEEPNFTLNVVDNPGNNFPEYPDEGSVKVNKVTGDVSQFQNTGVAEIQLSTSGIPIKRGVDVVLVADISNSMAWEAGTTGTSDAEKIASNVEDTKWYDLTQAASNFASILLEDYADGSKTANTISFVTFGGFDAERNNSTYSGYADATRTHFTSYSDAAQVSEIVSSIEILGKNSNNTVTYTISGMAAGNGTAQGGTNYDYAFLETASAIEQVKADYAAANGKSYDESGREIYVVFMTDGAPDHYNQLYYKTRSTSQFDYYALYRNTTDTVISQNYFTSEDDLPDYASFTQYQKPNGYYCGGVSNANWIDWIQSDSNYIAEQVLGMEGVNSITAIGFDLANGAFGGYTFGEEILTDVLTNLAGENSCQVMTTAKSDELIAFYESLAASIKMAATSAYFVDQMGSSFDLQMASTVTKFAGTAEESPITLTPAPTLTVSSYDIYKQSQVGTEVNGVTVTQNMVGLRYGSPTTMEVISFSEDGKQAYSSVIGEGINIINDDGVICGAYVYYNTDKRSAQTVDGITIEPETFHWNIGTINEKEFVLSYYVYLTGSAEGQASAGTYATNNYATLYYENYLDNDVSQDVQSPALAWESATVYYGFYLVDDYGNPVVNQATGQTGSFAESVKVTNKILYDTVLLNAQGEVTTISVESTNKPAEYEIYDNGASYTITIDSGNKVSGWVIENTVFVKDDGGNATAEGTTYVTDYRGTEYTNVEDSDTLTQTGMDYTATTVWFAVKYKPQSLPDTVVIDYGLPVDISVLANDMFGSAGSLVGVADKDSIPADGLDAETGKPGKAYAAEHSAAFTSTVNADYGTAKVNGEKVRYTPGTMAMDGYDKFAYEARYDKKNDAGEVTSSYYYNYVTVIPATTIYYEDNFVTYSTKTWNGSEMVPTTEKSVWSFVANGAAVQDEDRPGEYSLTDANNIYGYDPTNLSMSTYSLNGYAKATVDYDNMGVAEFDFYGTGFDVISMTDNTTGTITVKVYPYNDGVLSTTSVANYVVDTYYGYKYVDGAWEPANTTDNANSDKIYQVPVMQIENLPYDKYHAQIDAIYDPVFEHNTGSSSYDFYLDAIRIYDPANDGASDGADDTTIEDAYVADHEGWPSYIELRSKLIAEDKLKTDDGLGDVSTSTIIEGLVFIDGDAEIDEAQIADYISYGPNNEVYLAPGQRVAFQLSVPTVIDKVHIGIKSADGKVGTYTITSVADSDGADLNGDGTVDVNAGTYFNPKTFTISTTTDMYYDLTEWKDHIIVISNTGNREENGTKGIISLTNIKSTYTQNPNGTMVASVDETETYFETFAYVTPASARLAVQAVNSVAVEEEPDVPETSEPEGSEPENPETESSEPEASEPESSEPETSAPAETEPEETKPTQQEAVRETVKKIVKTVKNVLNKLFSRWF